MNETHAYYSLCEGRAVNVDKSIQPQRQLKIETVIQRRREDTEVTVVVLNKSAKAGFKLILSRRHQDNWHKLETDGDVVFNP